MTLVLQTPALVGLVFLPFAIVIGFWVAWSDLARMKIPNKAVLALAGVFLIIGPFVLPLSEYGWRWMNPVVMLFVGFILNQTGIIGAGDVKFVAAASLFFTPRDGALMLIPLALVFIAAIVAHRALRRVAFVRNAAPDWTSWDSKKFPAGLALGPFLVLYLTACAVWGS
ncbi:MAG: prepilin peptidase [Pseudomonadota bacterium]